MITLSFLASLIAFGLFGLATDKHHGKWLHRRSDRRLKMQMRVIAWAGILIALVLAFAAWGPVIGPIGWVGTMMFAAGVNFLTLNFLPVHPRTINRSEPPPKLGGAR